MLVLELCAEMLIANRTAGSQGKMNDKVYFCNVEKHQSYLQIDITIIGVCIQACLKFPPPPPKKVCICLQYLQKNMGDEVLLPADKHESFLQGDTILLPPLPCLNYARNLNFGR